MVKRSVYVVLLVFFLILVSINEKLRSQKHNSKTWFCE